MNNLKKLLSCLIILSVFLNTAVFVGAADKESNAESFAKGINLIDEESYNENKIITRAEFAGMLADLLRLNDSNADKNEWQENNFGASSEETVEINISARRFSDVDVSHPYYSQIMAVCQRGYMRGVSENLFAPEYNLVMGDAVRVFVNMLGYAEIAKLNSGISSSIGLTSGISTPMNEPTKKGDIIKLIYNALNINVLEAKFNGVEAGYETSEETFMTAVLKMDKVRGVLTDNGKTSFMGESKLSPNQVQVENLILEVDEDTEYVREFIGHTIDMYYSINYDEYKVVYAEIAKSDDSMTFDIKDFESFKDSAITYYNGNKSVRKSLADTVYMIYNGEAKTVFDESIFDFESGKVTLISTNGGEYNLIKVTCYEFAVVSGVSENSEVIYNKIKNSGDGNLSEIDCRVDSTYKNVEIKDTAGNNLLLSDLVQNDVLNILRNSEDIKIIVSKIKVDGFKVKSVSDDEEEGRMISNGEDKYAVSENYDSYSENIQFIMGNTYAIYLNMFDKIVWAEKYAEGENIGILTRARYSEEEGEPYRELRIYTSGGKLEKIKVAEKIKYNDVNKKFEDIVLELENYYGETVMYTIDKDGIITKLTMPEAFGTFGDRGWYEIAPEGSYQYSVNDKDLGQMIFYVPGTTTVFTVPKDASEYGNEKAFSVNTFSFPDGSITAKGYAKDKYNVIADVIVVKTTGAGVGAVSALSDILIIDKISQGLNADDEVVDVLEGWLINRATSTLEYTKISVSDECVMVEQRNGYEIDPNGDVKITGPRNFSELERGDAIRYDMNTNKEIYKIRIAYDASTGSYFNTAGGGSGSDLSLYPGQNEGSTSGSTWAGYALTKSGTGVRVTRRIDISPSSVNLSDAEEVKKSLYAFKVNKPNAILVVEKEDNGNIKMYKGSIDDLRTYQETKRNDDTDVLVMFTEWTSATRGTVIYKNFDFNQ